MTDISAVLVTHPSRKGQLFDEIRLSCTGGDMPEKLKDNDISVEGRNIEKVEILENEVIIHLSQKDPGAREYRINPKTGKAPVEGEPFNPAMVMPLMEYIEPSANICIGSEKIYVEGIKQITVDEFEAHKKYRLYYNLYKPQVVSGKEYPLVVFIPDASVNQNEAKLALIHGEGATSFACEEFQKAHPCYVLALQIPPRIPLVSDDYSCSEEIDDIGKIIFDVIEANPIDRNRIYILGGSQGCMSACELNCRFPDLFAASILIAGQWDPAKMADKCASKKLWIFVSDGDEKAYPGMKAVTEALRDKGSKVESFELDARNDPVEKELSIKRQGESLANVKFTVFKDHSVVPFGEEDNGGTNHMNTWPEVYSYMELKNWLFKQIK